MTKVIKDKTPAFEEIVLHLGKAQGNPQHVHSFTPPNSLLVEVIVLTPTLKIKLSWVKKQEYFVSHGVFSCSHATGFFIIELFPKYKKAQVVNKRLWFLDGFTFL